MAVNIALEGRDEDPTEHLSVGHSGKPSHQAGQCGIQSNAIRQGVCQWSCASFSSTHHRKLFPWNRKESVFKISLKGSWKELWVSDKQAQWVLLFVPVKAEAQRWVLSAFFSRVLLSGLCGSASYVMTGACIARNLGSFTRLILHSLSSASDIWSLAIPLVPGELLREVLTQVVRLRGEKKTGSSFPFRSRGCNAHSPWAMPCRLCCLVQD